MSMINLGYKGENIAFIVGCPRSGTTWLQRLLASHPKVRTGWESYLFTKYVGPQLREWRRDLDQSGKVVLHIGLGSYFRQEEFLSILKEYMSKLMEPMVGSLQPDEIFVDKTPSHALFLPEILELLPRSRIIHILRDPRDVVASMLAASRSPWGEWWAPRNAKAAIKAWLMHVRAVRHVAKDLSAEQFYELRYEELHGSTQEVLRSLYDFLSLEWGHEQIRRSIEQNSAEEGRTGGGTMIPRGGELAKLYGSFVKDPDGFVRRARPGSWKEDLSWLEKTSVWRKARKTMAEVGYAWSFPW